MVTQREYQAYAAAMQTMAGTRQVVMLYDGVIRYLMQAREAMVSKRIEDRFNNLTSAAEIVFGLQSCLDFENGGDVARILYNFYASVDTRIFSLHRTNDVALCDAIIAEIRQMRDVWEEIDRNISGGESASGSTESNNPPPASAPAASDGSTGIAISV